MDSHSSPQANAVGSPSSAEVANADRLVQFDAFFREHSAYVWTSLRRLGVDERDREDVASETLFRLYQKMDERDVARPAKPWIFAFAVRVASDYRRLARHRREVLGSDAIDRAIAPHDVTGETRQIVLAALETLDLDKRSVVILHDLDEQTIPEIAAALSIPIGTAYSRLRAGRAELATAIRAMNNGERVERSER
jgi:RNA polymerase sigma-70 factor (ECF subfamily)